ncbi:MAG: LPS O-antigen length regulator [Proteobacteria bacterium]|nr:LPS O-antigen length regulator [Pseudomonadota bacterium]
MTTTRSDNEGRTRPDDVAQIPAEGLVYVSPGPVFSGVSDDKISLRQIWRILWRGKRTVIAATTIFALGSIAYALLAKEIYRAEVLLAPAAEQSTPMIGGQLGGLAALAGLSVGEGNDVVSLAVLQSREFARDFIEQLDLMPIFFEEEWDAEKNRWREDDPTKAPDVRDGVKFFHEEIFEVSEERRTGLVTLAIEWTDPDVAAEWASILVHRLNDRLRERALQEAQTNVAYLQSEMAKATLVTLQESIGRLLEAELPKLMLAKGNEEFAFKIVDPAVPPRERVRPKRALTAIIGTILGGLLGIFIVLVGHSGRAGTDS